MPQKKKQVQRAGSAYPALRAEIIGFVKRMPGRTFAIHENGLQELCMWATEPERWLQHGCLTPDSLVQQHLLPEPDLTLALLSFIRKKWIGRNTKSQRIQNFLITHDAFAALPHSSPKRQWGLTDCEVATGFETATNEQVAVGDVVKARKSLARRVAHGIKCGRFPLWVRGGKTSKKPSV